MKSIFYSLALFATSTLADGIEGSLHSIVIEKFLASQDKPGFRLALEDRPQSYRGGRINCTLGVVNVPENGERYDCKGIDLYSFISSEELLIPGEQYLEQSSDIWGWTSPEGKELTLLTLDTGLVIIDSTDPTDPCIIAKSHSKRPPSPWGDVKVVNDHAYTIKDQSGPDTAPDVGMEIYELTQFAAMDCKQPDYEIVFVDADFTTDFHGECHNVVSNTESQRVYSCGCRTTCDGGLIILDVSENPLEPTFLGCIPDDGYTHDAQCVVYDGPDTRYTGKEICFAFNEDTLTIWDLTNPQSPILVSRTFYENQFYSHQGWLNKDMTKVLLDDELDEDCNKNFVGRCQTLPQSGRSGKTTTTTNVFDVTDLTKPVRESVFDFQTESIDHNLYEWGTIHRKGWSGSGRQTIIPDPDLAYMHNYMSGLRIVDIADSDSNNWVERKFFDITDETVIEFFGAWSGYMFPSGHYALSSIEKGIFFLDTNTAFIDVDDEGNGDDGSGNTNTEEDDDGPDITAILVFVLCFVIVGGFAYMYLKVHGPKMFEKTRVDDSKIAVEEATL